MEDYVIIILSLSLMTCCLIGIKMFRAETKPKEVKTKTTEAKDTLSKVQQDTITRLSVELKKAHGRANRLQALRNDEVELEDELPAENGEKQVTFEEIQALVDASYPKYSKLLPLVKKQVMDATKGMTMKEILNYVKEFTGNQQPEGTPSQESTQYRADWA